MIHKLKDLLRILIYHRDFHIIHTDYISESVEHNQFLERQLEIKRNDVDRLTIESVELKKVIDGLGEENIGLQKRINDLEDDQRRWDLLDL